LFESFTTWGVASAVLLVIIAPGRVPIL
jgi:hypothetical protein